MILIARGQINFIGQIEKFDKGRRSKIIVALTQENTDKKNQLEYIPYELLDDKVNWVEQHFLEVGDYLEIAFEQRGRKYVPDNNPQKPIFYLSNEMLEIITKK